MKKHPEDRKFELCTHDEASGGKKDRRQAIEGALTLIGILQPWPHRDSLVTETALNVLLIRRAPVSRASPSRSVRGWSTCSSNDMI